MKKEFVARLMRRSSRISPLLAAGSVLDMGATAMVSRVGSSKLRGTVEERVGRDWEAVARDFRRVGVARDTGPGPGSGVPEQADDK
jgi:hypothetical protein